MIDFILIATIGNSEILPDHSGCNYTKKSNSNLFQLDDH